MNSTKVQSGESHENISQFFVNVSWNFGLTSYLCLCLSFTKLFDKSI